MADLFDLLQSQVGESLVGALTNQMGSNASNQQTSSAMNGAMSILMKALTKNATNTDGASALGAALDRDHDGSILDDVVGFVNGSSQFNQTKAADGAGILGHILGSNQNGAIDAVSKMSGLSQGQSGNLLIKLAPIVLGMLGKQKKSQNLNPMDLSNILTQSSKSVDKKINNPGLLTSFLDADGDGSIKDEAASFGFKLLRNFFSRKR